MKIRYGFVSNSSSTSYTCELCGATESGWDSSGIEDFGFVRCPNKHVICTEEAIPISDGVAQIMIAEMAANPEWVQWMQDEQDEGDKFDPNKLSVNEITDYYSQYQSEFGDGETIGCTQCPICTFEIISDKDFERYLKELHKVPEDEVLAFIKGGNKRRKRIYSGEYISYVLNKINKQRLELEANIRTSFQTYDDFYEHLRSKR